MMDEDFTPEVNANEWMMDVAAYRQWQLPSAPEDGECRDKLYNGLRDEATGLYYQLLDTSERTSDKSAMRLFRYLQGDSVEDIASTETPPVSRQAVHKCLQITIRGLGVGVKRMRFVWNWGQLTYSSTAICDHQQNPPVLSKDVSPHYHAGMRVS